MNHPKQTSKEQSLKFRFDISTFKLLGRELITDRITALFELVKNSYDANANKVWVEFYNVNTLGRNSKIIIRDDGLGMSYEDLRDKWMVIGANNKRVNDYSPKPYQRKYVGEKGVGRFAVDKLGSKLTLKTKRKTSNVTHTLIIDWKKYEDEANKQVQEGKQLNLFGSKGEDLEKNYFTDVENSILTERQDDNSQGTTLEIEYIRDVWVEDDIKRAFQELAKIVSPLKKQLTYPFDIFLQCNDYEQYQTQIKVENNAIQFNTETFVLSFDLEQQLQEVLTLKGKKLSKKWSQPSKMGMVKFTLYYFDQQAKRMYKNAYQGASIDGIKIYRDDIITTPFAEYATSDLKKRDILGIDKRRYSGFFDKVSSKDLIGIVEITKENNPCIIDSTNRQDFVDNEEYRELKNFIIRQLRIFEQYSKLQKRENKEQVIRSLQNANEDFKNLNEVIADVQKQAPNHLKPLFNKLRDTSGQIKEKLNIGEKALKESEKDRIRQENLFLSLMSLQNYATQIAHVVRTVIQQIGSRAVFFVKRFPNENLNSTFLKYATQIQEGMEKLEKAVDFMLSYASSNANFEDINLKELIENLFYNIYDLTFKENSVDISVKVDSNIEVIHNRQFFEDIFSNLISNSIKALSNTTNKLIQCTGVKNQKGFEILFSDNGCGIEKDDRDRIFEIYYTKTENQKGAGIGLYIVKERINALKGTIEVIEPELKPTGATFKIVIPFK